MKTRMKITMYKCFPAYIHTRERLVSTHWLALAKMKACDLFRENHCEYKRVFRQYARRRRKCKPSAIKFSPLWLSLDRIRDATLIKCDDAYGWTFGHKIMISNSIPMTFDMLVGTLLHEELHCFCTARGKYLSADSEHHCMHVLGEI